MLKRILIMGPAAFGLGILIKSIGIVFNMIVHWQSFSVVSFHNQFKAAELIMKDYNVVIFSTSAVIMLLLTIIDYYKSKTNNGNSYQLFRKV